MTFTVFLSNGLVHLSTLLTPMLCREVKILATPTCRSSLSTHFCFPTLNKLKQSTLWLTRIILPWQEVLNLLERVVKTSTIWFFTDDLKAQSQSTAWRCFWRLDIFALLLQIPWDLFLSVTATHLLSVNMLQMCFLPAASLSTKKKLFTSTKSLKNRQSSYFQSPHLY